MCDECSSWHWNNATELPEPHCPWCDPYLEHLLKGKGKGDKVADGTQSSTDSTPTVSVEEPALEPEASLQDERAERWKLLEEIHHLEETPRVRAWTRERLDRFDPEEDLVDSYKTFKDTLPPEDKRKALMEVLPSTEEPIIPTIAGDTVVFSAPTDKIAHEQGVDSGTRGHVAVSYTHLTLPTILRV